MNDSWNHLVGRTITFRFDPHVFITLELSWLKQLRAQYMLGVPEPLLRLPGVIGKYKTNSEYRINTGYFPEGIASSKPRIIADRINEPGCEWQLRVIRGTN
nr:MAG TPA: hypothetical protein [Caudoviricetes sp.]